MKCFVCNKEINGLDVYGGPHLETCLDHFWGFDNVVRVYQLAKDDPVKFSLLIETIDLDTYNAYDYYYKSLSIVERLTATLFEIKSYEIVGYKNPYRSD